MELKREKLKHIDQEQMLDKFRTTEIYSRIMQHPKEDGDTANGELVELLFGQDSAFWTIREFINGKLEKNAAIELFRQETEIVLKRFSDVKDFYESLFFMLVTMAQSIYLINKETEKKVEEVMDKDEPAPKPAIEEVESVGEKALKLKKGKLEPIENAQIIKITIERKGKKKNHVIVIDKLKESLRVTCPTSDLPSGKKQYTEIPVNEEHVIGMACKRQVNRLLRKHDKEIEEARKAESRGRHYKVISEESAEYKKFSALAAKHSAEAKKLMGEIKALRANPLFHWFDEEKSKDIKPEQLVVTLKEDGTIELIDDGENGETIVEVEMKI